MVNDPLPRTFQQLQINNTISGFYASFIFSMALAFKFASIIAFIVKERADRSKHQQIVSGMNIRAYWTANLVYDYVLYLVISVLAIVIAIGLDVQFITEGNALAAIWMLFIFYGLSYISFTYVASFIFKDYGTAQASYYFITLILGGLLPILVFLLRVLGDSTNPVGKGLAWGLRLYPAFAFGEGVLNIGSVTLYGIR
jgi:ATP-binding cassette, subfamily A (ABC1), member 3